MITWVFEEGTFVPAARITDSGSQSIITDYLGTPTAMYDAKGEKTWETNLDIYGKVRTFAGRSLSDCPFRYQGQYEDTETGLYYNGFRYYDPNTGYYLSKDPIGLLGGFRTYGYVCDPLGWLDVFGLAGQRWQNKTKKDGTPYKKPGPKSKGTGDHNAKIEEIIKRETAKPGVEHIGGGNKAEIIIETPGGHKDIRRMDASFKVDDIYHINVGRTLEDSKTGVIRERLALEDAKSAGHNVSFEGYSKDSDYGLKPKKHNH
jgi:RHS repeat-associated protein